MKPNRRVGSDKPATTTFSIAASILGIATAGAVLLVDARAYAPFDAPKRLVAMLGIAAAVAIAGPQAVRALRAGCRAQWLAFLTGVAGITLMVVAAIFSPHRPVALDGVRTVLLFAVVPLIAATDERVWRRVAAGFVTGSAINAALSLLQLAGVIRLFQYATKGGRANTSALIGNDGFLSLTLALSAVVAFGWLLHARKSSYRRLATVLLVLFAASMTFNLSWTAWLVFLSGAGMLGLLWVTPARRALSLASFAAVVVMSVAVLALPRDAALDAKLTFRMGAWDAAKEMLRDRPLLGFGTGTYASEFATHRIRADFHAGRRLDNPGLVGSYAEAHNDVLQTLAENGIPATLAFCIAIGSALWIAARGERGEHDVVLAVIIAATVAAVTWFPMQRPATALLTLAAIGRAWRSR